MQIGDHSLIPQRFSVKVRSGTLGLHEAKRRSVAPAGRRRRSHDGTARPTLHMFVRLVPWILVPASAEPLADIAEKDAVRPPANSIFIEIPVNPNLPIAASRIHLRARAVMIESTELTELRDAGGGALTLNLFDDAVLAATVEEVAIHSKGFSLSGRLDGSDGGRFNLVVRNDVLVGIIRTDGNAAYHVRYLGGGTHIVRQVDPTAFPRCGVTPESVDRLHNAQVERAKSKATVGDAVSKAAAGGSSDDGSVHDILVLYSDVTRQAAGGTSAIRAEIQLSIDAANDAYADSGIVSRLRLVHMDEVSYDEDTGWDGYLDHLVRLWEPADGYYDQAHELRIRFGADLVTLIVEDTDPDFLGNRTCGLAPVMQEMSADFESDALSVVSRECSGDNWTLAHEIGHNQGCAHDRENVNVDGVFTHSYGHRFTGDTRGWGTIMAYNDAQNTWQPFGQFSNPNLSHDGAATGVPIGSPGEAHNTATINSTRVTVARFRTTRYWVDFDTSGVENGLFDSPFSELLEGLEAVPEGGMVVIKSGFHSEGMTLTKRLKINSWNGSTIIGAASP